MALHSVNRRQERRAGGGGDAESGDERGVL